MKVSELIQELQEMLKETDPDAEVQIQTNDGCAGPDGWFKNPWTEFGWDDKTIMICAEKGCMCVSRKNCIPLPEAIKENVEMRKAFFEIRKLAFLDKLDRNRMLELAVKFVGNQPQGVVDEKE